MEILDQYLLRPVLFDMVATVLLLSANQILINKGFQLYAYTQEAINDLLNELISSSLSLGGFVLAAMAIIASMKESTTKVDDYKDGKTGKEFFFNSPAYKPLINSYQWACILYGGVFLLFSIVRTISDSLDVKTLFLLTYLGLFISLFTLVRCIFLIQAVVKIK